MADRSPADRSPADRRPPRETKAAGKPADNPAAEPEHEAETLLPTGRPLSDRWWWSGVATAVVGGVLIGFQWEVIGVGEGIPANWVMAAIGAGIVVAGLVILYRDWRRQRS